jgi:hypothetical protein
LYFTVPVAELRDQIALVESDADQNAGGLRLRRLFF